MRDGIFFSVQCALQYSKEQALFLFLSFSFSLAKISLGFF